MSKFLTSHSKFSEQWVALNRTVITGWNVTFYSSAPVCTDWKTRSIKLDVKKIVSNHSGDKKATHITWTVWKYEDPLLYKAKTVHPVHIQGVPGGMDKTSGVFLMLKYTDITQNTYIQSW